MDEDFDFAKMQEGPNEGQRGLLDGYGVFIRLSRDQMDERV